MRWHQSESSGRSCNRTDVFFHFKNSRREMNEQDLPEQRRPSGEGDGVGGACCSVGGWSLPLSQTRVRRSGPLRWLEGSLPSRPTTSDCPSAAGGVNIPCKPQREGSVSATHRRNRLVSAQLPRTRAAVFFVCSTRDSDSLLWVTECKREKALLQTVIEFCQ